MSRFPDPGAFGSWNLGAAESREAATRWVWEGFIADKCVTLLTGAPKVGKSTLLGLLLERRRAGGQVLGRAVEAGTTVVVSEEEPLFWARRQERLDFGPRVCFYSPSVLSPAGWGRCVDEVLGLHMREPFELLVIDSLATFVPAAPNSARLWRRVLENIRLLASMPAGVLLLHHPRRAGGRPGQTAGGRLSAFADILLDLHVPPGESEPGTRRRQLDGLGRFSETPPCLHIELNPEATDYAVLAETDAAAALAPSMLDAVRAALGRAPRPMTRQEILDSWPDPATRPAPVSLWRWLSRACDLGILTCHGQGNRLDPFRYTLAGADATPPPPPRRTLFLKRGDGLILEIGPRPETPADATTPVDSPAVPIPPVSESAASEPDSGMRSAPPNESTGEPAPSEAQPSTLADTRSAPKSGQAPALPPHAGWLLGYAPEQAERDKAG